jgi:hypothetical protein
MKSSDHFYKNGTGMDHFFPKNETSISHNIILQNSERVAVHAQLLFI